MGENVKQRSGLGKKGIKRYLLGAVVVVFIASLAAGGLALNRHYKSSHQCDGKEGNPLYREAARNLNQTTYRELEGVVAKIKKQRNYKKDANCLYPVVEYYVYIGDQKNAKAAFADLEKAYDANKKFVKVYGPRVTKIEDVKADVDGLDKAADELNRNRQFFD